MFFKLKRSNNDIDGYGEDPYLAPVSNGRHAPQQLEPSFIAADVVVHGQVVSGGELHINGTVMGSVEAQTCVIEAEGRVEGEVRAGAIFVHGQVMGPLQANHVHVFPNAVVRGDIVHETIKIESGADVLGQFLRNGMHSQNALFARTQQRAPQAQAAPLAAEPGDSAALFDTIFHNSGEEAANQAPLAAVQPKFLKR